MSEWCEQGKLGRPDRDGSVKAGWEIRAGPGISLGAARPLHNFAIFIVLNFERGEKLETALLSISILCSICLGIWIDSNLEVMYALATRITFICPMRFNAFPMDIQVSLSNSLHLFIPFNLNKCLTCILTSLEMVRVKSSLCN